MAPGLVASRRPIAAERAIEPRALAASLFGLSFATALFALASFKLLSFFVMPSLFFDLLFIGFPLGALLGARSSATGRRPFLGSLVSLQVIMAASVAASLLAQRFDYLRAHLFDVELPRLIGQVAAFAGLFLPYFAAYGLCEFLGYRLGRKALGGRMRAVYALALFGAAAAYLFLNAALPALGMARVLMCAFAGVALAMFALAGRLGRILAAVEILALGAAMLAPDVEGSFLTLYKGRGRQSTWDFRENLGCRTVFQKWGRYSLCEILADPKGPKYYGFYNDLFQWEYAPKMGFSEPSLGALPILQTRRGDRIAIVGAGGGRQVRLAERLGGREIVAIELEPAVFEALRGEKHLLRASGRVYEAPGVTPVLGEARTYFERSPKKFDLIYMPSVGGYAQMMIEPGNMVRTYQAYRLMRDRLTDRGVLAIWYPIGLDGQGVLTAQYVRTLRALGLSTQAYVNDIEFLILAYRNPATPTPDLGAIRDDLKLTDPAAYALWPRRFDVDDDPNFTPITDEKPFLAGNVRHILSIGQVRTLFALAVVVLGAAGVATWSVLRRRGDPEIPGRPLPAVALVSLLVGANFVLVEHLLVLALFRRIFVYEDALGLGAVAFLTLSALGSLAASARMRPALLGAATVALIVLLAVPGRLSPLGIVAAVAPVALATGTFFPALFDRSARNPLVVFALDALGAGFGTVAATFVPILWGFDTFFALAALVFVVTAGADAWFHRPPADG